MVLLHRGGIQLQDFLLSNTFSDVTLFGEQNTQVRAHALVLASVSPLLRDCLLGSNSEDLSIVFPHVKAWELQLLLQFLYTGAVDLPSKETYDSFLGLIDYLRIQLNPQEIPLLEEEDLGLNAGRLHSVDDLWVLKDSGNALTTLDDSEILYEFPIKMEETPNQQLILPLELENINPVPLSSEDPSAADPPSPSERTKRHTCSHCLKSFPSKYYLKFHLSSVHASEASHSCSICNKGFRGGYYLRQHMRRMHAEGGRPHSCSICSASFGLKYDLLIHSRTHERRFPCGLCGKSYSSSRALKDHSRTHTGERPYECTECKKTFALPKTLRVHYRQHSGERPYLCPSCGMTFIQNSTLKHHIKTIHKAS